MKFLYILLLLLPVTALQSQSKTKSKAKAPTQKDMEAALKDARKMMDEAMSEMSEEDKRMMDSMGIKMPDLKKVKVPKATDQQLANAWENENRLVPKRDDQRIASIPKGLTQARLTTYIATVQKKLMSQLDSKAIANANTIFDQIRSTAKSQRQAGSMAAAFWMSGQPELALYLLGRVCMDDPTQTDNLSNYAAALSMQGGEHLAIPILQNLNAKYRRNSTILNNLGQAWFGLGDMVKASSYLDSAIAIFPNHPQATQTKAVIEESKGNTAKAVEYMTRSIRYLYSKDKEEKLAKLGYKLKVNDLWSPIKPSADPLGLSRTKRPDYPASIAQIDALLPMWEDFNMACDAAIERVRKEMKEVGEKYAASTAGVATQITTVVNQGGVPVFREPIFMRKASLNLMERRDFYEVKFKKEKERFLEFRSDIDKIRGKHLRKNVPDNCAAHRDAINAMLKDLNERKKQYDDEMLKLYRQYCNDMVYWSQYTNVDANGLKLVELEFLLLWLEKNREYQPLDMQKYKGMYKDCVNEEKAGPGKLSEFDDVACNYRARFDFGIVEQEINCSHTKTTYHFGSHDIEERELGNKYTGSTIKVKPSLKAGTEAGPLEVEAFIEAELVIELDETRTVKEWKGTINTGIETSAGMENTPVSVKGSVKTEIEIEISSRGIDDVSMVGTAEVEAGAMGQTATIGVQDRVSLISGRGSVTGTGIMKGVTITSW